MSSVRRTICVVLVDRANYGRLKPVMRAIDAHPQLELQVVAAGTMVLERFHQPVQIVRQDGCGPCGPVPLSTAVTNTPIAVPSSIRIGDPDMPDSRALAAAVMPSAPPQCCT